MIVGRVNPNQTLEDNGIFNTAKIFYNLKDHDLITEAIKREEGVLGNGGLFLSLLENILADPQKINLL